MPTTVMTDRSTAPALKSIDSLSIYEPKVSKLDNGISLYVLDMLPTQEIIKLELIFKAGRWFEPQKQISGLTAKMLKEGTVKYTSKEISEKIEFHGATLKTESGFDEATITLTCLSKHLNNLLPLLKELLTESIFPDSELQTVLSNKKQKLLVQLEQVDFLARDRFKAVLFGNEHPYGYPSNIKDYDQVNTSTLKDFYDNYYTVSNCTVIASGKVNNELIKLINENLGKDDWGKNKTSFNTINISFNPSNQKEIIIEKKDSVQSAIRLGMPLFNKTHKDFPGMLVLNTTFGGYFGSRLMANIREDKGYTYGIYSSIASMVHTGYFYISAEVGADVCKNAISEIFKEIDLLRNELIADNELELVKNYLTGNLLSMIDGAFHYSETLKNMMVLGLDSTYLTTLFNTTKNITAAELQALANKYFIKENMYTLIAGKK